MLTSGKSFIYLTVPEPEYDIIMTSKPDLQIGQREVELPVEAPWSTKSWVNGVNTIGGTNDNNLPSRVYPIHQSQQSWNNGAVNLVLATGTHRSKSINLIKKDDGWTHLIGLKLEIKETKN